MLNFNYNIQPFRHCRHRRLDGTLRKHEQHGSPPMAGLVTENWFDLNASRYTPSSTLQRMELLKTGYMGTLSLGWDNYLFLELTGRQERFVYPKKTKVFLSFRQSEFPLHPSLPHACHGWNYGKLRPLYGIVGNAPETYTANIIYEQGSDNGFMEHHSPSWGMQISVRKKKYEYEIGFESKFLNNRLGYRCILLQQPCKGPDTLHAATFYIRRKECVDGCGRGANQGWDIQSVPLPY